jgi:hypothetical protein
MTSNRRRKDGKWQARIGRIGESRDTKDIFTLGPLVGVVISHIDLLALQSFPHFSLCENSLSLLISIA